MDTLGYQRPSLHVSKSLIKITRAVGAPIFVRCSQLPTPRPCCWGDQSSKSVLRATKAQLKAAEIANEGITLEYDSGNTRTTLEVIQSRSILLDSRIAYAKAQRDFMVSQFELAKQIGILSQNLVK